MNKTNIDKLIDITFKNLISNNCKILDKVTRKNDIENLWNDVCSEYFNNNFTYKDKVNFFSMWNRNQLNYRSRVMKKLNDKINFDTIRIDSYNSPNENTDNKIKTIIVQIPLTTFQP